MVDRAVPDRDVRRAIGDINAAVEALVRENANGWHSAAQRFVYLLRQPIPHAVLSESPVTFDAAATREEMRKANAGRMGHDPVALPFAAADRASVAAAILEYVAELSPKEYLNALIDFISMQGGVQGMLNKTNLHLVQPVFTHLVGRLEELLAPQVADASRLVVSGEGNVVIIESTVDRSAFGTTGATVNYSAYDARTEHGREVMSWLSLLGDVEKDRHEETRGAIVALAKAIDSDSQQLGPVVSAAETIGHASPKLQARLIDFTKHVGIHLTAMGIAHNLPLWVAALQLVVTRAFGGG
jgi:hypothetical protein